MNYGYIRVSTDKQTVKNQKIAIRDYARKYRIRNIQWYEETISGTKSLKRRVLGKMIDELQPGDTVILTEISRLGRSMFIIMEAIEKFIQKGIKVIAIKEGFTLENNIQSKVLLFAFSLSAEVERDLLSERTKLGLARARKEGKQIGRRPGQKPKKYKLTGNLAYIKRELAKGRTRASLAKELEVEWRTLNAFLKRNKVVY